METTPTPVQVTTTQAKYLVKVDRAAGAVRVALIRVNEEATREAASFAAGSRVEPVRNVDKLNEAIASYHALLGLADSFGIDDALIVAIQKDELSVWDLKVSD